MYHFPYKLSKVAIEAVIGAVALAGMVYGSIKTIDWIRANNELQPHPKSEITAEVIREEFYYGENLYRLRVREENLDNELLIIISGTREEKLNLEGRVDLGGKVKFKTNPNNGDSPVYIGSRTATIQANSIEIDNPK